jgi:hypothetical protein
MSTSVASAPASAESQSRRGAANNFWASHWHFAVLMACFVAFFLWQHMTNAFINIFEMGVYFEGGRRVLEGQIPHRDFFSIYGPALYYMSALSLLATRSVVDANWLMFTILNVIDAILIYAIARDLVQSRPLQLLPVFAGLTWSATSYRMLLALVSLVLLFAWLKKPGRRWIVGAGVAAGLSFFVLQDVLPFFACSVIAWFVILALARPEAGSGNRLARPEAGSENRLLDAAKLSALFLGSVAAAVVPVLCWMAFTGELRWYWQDAFVVTVKQYATHRFSHYPAPWQLNPDGAEAARQWQALGVGGKSIRWALYTLPYYFVPLVYLATLADCFLRLRGRQAAQADFMRLLIALFGLFIYRQVLMNSDLPHLETNTTPATLLIPSFLALLLPGKSPASPAWRKQGAALCALLTLAVALFCIYPTAHTWFHKQGRSYKVALGVGPRTADPGWPAIWDTVTFLQARTAHREKVLCLPTCPLFYELGDWRNPTKYSYYDPIIASIAEPDALQTLKRNPPRYCILRANAVFWDHEMFGRDYCVALQQWLNQNYSPIHRSEDYIVLQYHS